MSLLQIPQNRKMAEAEILYAHIQHPQWRQIDRILLQLEDTC